LNYKFKGGIKNMEKKLYEYYLSLQSSEWKEDILGWESFNEPGTKVSIKVNFTWGWLRVYQKQNGEIEWY
jgi:hypothetical protein